MLPSPGVDHAPLQILAGDKFFSRLLSKEISAANPSFRVYYGVASAGSVPFLWESQPGTPKNAAPDSSLPPLTPPPSFYFNSSQKLLHRKSSRKCPPRRLIRAFLPRRKPRGLRIPPPVSVSSWEEEEESEEARMSPTSALCFGDRMDFKKALLSIVGFGSGQA